MSAQGAKTVRNVVIFSVLVNGIGWVGSTLGGDPSSPGSGFFLWATAPILAALLIRAATKDWGDLGAKPAIGKSPQWYLVSLLAYPIAMSVALILGSQISASSISGFSISAFIQAALPGLVIIFIFAFIEEFAWRGYLAPKLYSLKLNAFLAHALVAIVWASWHLPYIRELSTYTSEGMATFLPRFYLGAFAFSIVYGEIRMLTATFWPAVLMHWVGNAMANPLVAEFVSLSAGKEFLGSIAVDGLFMIALFGILGVVINRWRTRQNAGIPSTA